MILHGLQNQTSPTTPRHGYDNSSEPKYSSSTYSESRAHRRYSINHSGDYDTIPLDNTAVRNQKEAVRSYP